MFGRWLGRAPWCCCWVTVTHGLLVEIHESCWQIRQIWQILIFLLRFLWTCRGKSTKNPMVFLIIVPIKIAAITAGIPYTPHLSYSPLTQGGGPPTWLSYINSKVHDWVKATGFFDITMSNHHLSQANHRTEWAIWITTGGYPTKHPFLHHVFLNHC